MIEPGASDRTGSDDPSPSAGLAWIALVPIALAVFFALAGPIVSGDLWWHLETGDWILDHGELPERDPFSHTAGDRAWTLEEYGSQVLFALLHRAGGLWALRHVGALLGVLVLVAAFRSARASVPPFWAAAATALFALLFALKWELRPHLLSVFFLFRLQHLLFPRERERDPSPRTWVEVFLLTAVWVQLHAEAIFVPILAIAGLIGAALGSGLDREGGSARIRAWAGVLLAGTLGSLCSPEGWNQFLYAVSDSSVPRTYIEEWFPGWILPGDPRFAPLTPSVFVAMSTSVMLGGGFVLAHAVRRLTGGRGGIPWERIGFLAVCVLMALLARRFFWLLFFPMLDLAASLLAVLPRARSWRVVPATILLGLALLLTDTHYVKLGRESLGTGAWEEHVNAGLFPVHAAELLSEAELEGNLFHRYEWGGFLGFQLWPRCRVFLDGRTVLFADVIPERWEAERWATLARYDEGVDGAKVAERIFEQRDVRVIVMPSLVDHGAGVAPWRPPGANVNWIRIWADATAIVWVRRTDRENLERARTWFERQGIAFDPQRGFVEAQALWARPEWIRERGLLSPVVRELVEPKLLGDEPGVLPRWPREARVETWLGLGMGRSARWELEQLIEETTAGDEATRDAWLDSLETETPAVVFGRLLRGERP